MRLSIFKIIALIVFGLGFSFVLSTAYAQQRYCAGSCDAFGNPNYDVPELPDETQLDSPEYDEESEVGEPVYRIQPDYNYRNERRYRRHQRTARHKNHRRNRYVKRRQHRRVYDGGWNGGIDYSNRTEFCRERYERRGDGWFKRKVKVRRCVWVRNDLLGNNHGTDRYADDW